MKFYVIYSVDVPEDECAESYAPNIGDWARTEEDESYDYDYLEGIWENGHHGKWVALLTRGEFERWNYLYPEDCETGGSITEMGWLPAISFNGEGDVIENAYVTPVPEIRGQECANASAHDWERVRCAVIRQYS